MKISAHLVVALILCLSEAFFSGCTKRETGSPPKAQEKSEAARDSGLREPIPELKELSPKQSDEIIKLVNAKIGSEFVGPDGKSLSGSHPLARARMATLLKVACAPGRGNRLTMQANARSGKLLPQQVSTILLANKKFDQLLMDGEVPFLNNSDSIFDSAYVFFLTVLNGTVSAQSLSDQIYSIAERTPDTDIDMTLYFAISAGIREGGGGMRTDTFPLDSLASMSQARNPIARLLAIEALPRAVPEGVTLPPSTEDQDTSLVDRARVEALMRFQGETDPVILGRLIDSLGALRIAEANQALEKIAEQQVTLGHDELAKRAMSQLKR